MVQANGTDGVNGIVFARCLLVQTTHTLKASNAEEQTPELESGGSKAGEHLRPPQRVGSGLLRREKH